MKRLMQVVSVVVLGCAPGWAQEAARPPAAVPKAYDVVVINPSKVGTNSMRISVRDATFQASNVSLKQLLTNAYGIRGPLILGLPGWAESARYDISAKIVDADPKALNNVSRDKRNALLIAMLADRFGLKAHTETREQAVFALVVGKDGPKIQPTTAPDDSPDPTVRTAGNMSMSGKELTAVGVPISDLARALESVVDRSVVDRTGLTGKYDVYLTWLPEQEANADNGVTDGPPPLFTAVQEQLGLKLEPAKAQVPTLVVDAIQPPSPN